MKRLYACCILLATGLMVDGSPLNLGSGGAQNFGQGGGAYFANYGSQMSGGSVYNGAAIAVSNNNGKLEIYINGKFVDLNQATVLEDNSQYQVLEPQGFPGARISVYKANGQIRVDYGGAHYQSITPEMASAQISLEMLAMDQKINRMNENLSKMFTGGFPFSRGFLNF